MSINKSFCIQYKSFLGLIYARCGKLKSVSKELEFIREMSDSEILDRYYEETKEFDDMIDEKDETVFAECITFKRLRLDEVVTVLKGGKNGEDEVNAIWGKLAGMKQGVVISKGCGDNIEELEKIAKKFTQNGVLNGIDPKSPHCLSKIMETFIQNPDTMTDLFGIMKSKSTIQAMLKSFGPIMGAKNLDTSSLNEMVENMTDEEMKEISDPATIKEFSGSGAGAAAMAMFGNSNNLGEMFQNINKNIEEEKQKMQIEEIIDEQPEEVNEKPEDLEEPEEEVKKPEEPVADDPSSLKIEIIG